MKKIENLVHRIEEELADAKEYAEQYLECKAEGGLRYEVYKTMASQELQHADNIHQIAVDKINELKKVYTPPVEMEDEWARSHKVFIEKSAWIKQMLAM